MSLSKLSKEEINQNSMLYLASLVLKEEKKPMEFHEIFERITDLKGFTEAEKENFIAQFYTEVNVDGRFMTLGNNTWGLKEWYPVDKQEEEVTSTKKKKSKKKKVEEEEPKLAEDGFDAIEEDLDFDDNVDEAIEEVDEEIEEELEPEFDIEEDRK